MPQTKTPLEINKFVGGLHTDASPLTFPENTSSVDVNMVLNSDGSRQRTLGIDYEDDYTLCTTTISSALTLPIAYNTFRWENVGGDPTQIFLVVQFGNEIKFYRTENSTISGALVGTRLFSTSLPFQRFSFAAVDGNLVIATGINLITTVVFESNAFSFTTSTIKVRDFFGVEDFDGSVDMTVASGLQRRPAGLTMAHRYNLRNQGFGVPRMYQGDENLTDPILAFRTEHITSVGSSKYPSNSDTVSEFLISDANDTADRISRRYWAVDAIKNPLGSTQAAQGYFIIDLLARGASRESEYDNNQVLYPQLTFPLTTLPVDNTSGGATAVGEFAGRVWYGGFSGEVTGGDDKSPRLSSYVAFSQLVSDPTQTTLCYQEGDPTSDVSPDIIDTDGGFVRINNAYGITSLVNLGKSFMVCAKNGIWRIYGGNDSGFSATNYVVEKITDKGVRGASSVVQVENTIMYWSEDGIYHLKQNEYGDWSSTNLTQNRIQTLYNDILVEHKENVVGVYDGFQRKVRWLYGNLLNATSQQKELVLDINLNAFYERHITPISDSGVPILMGGFNSNTFKVDASINQVVLETVDDVVVGVDNVVISSDVRSSANSLYEVGYVIVTQISPVIIYTFGAYTDTEFVDWRSYDGVGVDAEATLVTGQASGGDNMRYKQIPYLYVHSRRTENGFEADINGDFVPVNQSSCTVQSQWDWANSVNSNKWGTPFQAYRYKRHYFPSGIGDTFDTGHETIITKNKLRGRGRAISLKFTSSPAKEMHIYGWSLLMAMNTNV